MQNCTATLENTWVVSSKVKYALCMISNSTPRLNLGEMKTSAHTRMSSGTDVKDHYLAALSLV